MIQNNISHETYLPPEMQGGEFDNLPGYLYHDVKEEVHIRLFLSVSQLTTGFYTAWTIHSLRNPQ